MQTKLLTSKKRLIMTNTSQQVCRGKADAGWDGAWDNKCLEMNPPKSQPKIILLKCVYVPWAARCVSVSSTFSYLSRCRCVCAGPCPWRLLWFNSAPHGWTQSDTSEPVKGDVQWSWRYTTAALQKRRQPGSQTMITCKDASHPCKNHRNLLIFRL